MISIEWLREDAVLAVRPQGPVEETDFASVASVVDPAISRHGHLEGLLVDARGFAGWDDTRALLTHMRFVDAHVANVARIAVVGDQWWLRAAPAMEPFHGTPIRHFAAAEEAAAKSWLLENTPVPAIVTILPESEGALVGVHITGRLRDADYKKFQAEMMARLPEDGKLRLLVVVDENFRGWTPKACLDDIAMVFAPWRRRFEKLAVVAGPGLVRWCVEHFPSALLPYPMKAFSESEMDTAWSWLRA